MTIRDAQTFEPHVGPGILGIYVQLLTPKVKTTLYKYLMMCSARSAVKRETVTVVTNDPVVQSIATKLGMKSDTDWKLCDFLYVFVTDNDTHSAYLEDVLREVPCSHQTVSLDYVPENTRRLIDPSRIREVPEEDPEMGVNPFIKPAVRPFANPYPVVPHKPTPMYQQRIFSSVSTETLQRDLLKKYNLLDLIISVDASGDFMNLESIALDPKDRGAGTGSKVIAELKVFCKKHGIPEIHLTSADSPKTRAFYLKNGFVRVPTVKGRLDYVATI